MLKEINGHQIPSIPDFRVRQTLTGSNSEVLGPDFWKTTPETAAEIMIGILSANYGAHNLTNNRAKLVESIATGNLLPFINTTSDACAALIKLGEHDVEIGRAACLPKTNGGKSAPIISAFTAWQNGTAFPESQILRAEVRTAKPTKEVPGGQATQVVFLQDNKLGFHPTAIGPFFHHGNPDRQEFFVLANRCKDQADLTTVATDLAIPEAILENDNELRILSQLWQNIFGANPKIESSTFFGDRQFSLQENGPFVLVIPSDYNDNSWTLQLEQKLSQDFRFALARFPLHNSLDPSTTAGIKTLKKAGLKLLGFEPVINQGEWGIDLLMGKLSAEGRSRLLLPCFTENVFSHNMEDLLVQNAIDWRKNGT